MPSSFALGPPKDTPGLLFLKSQLFTSPRWPCSDTNLTEKVALVTGATSGLGLEACRQLLDFGSSGLIMAVRSTEKGAKVASDFGIQYPKANIKVWHLEMESYDSVRALACRAETELLRLDIAILNAGMQTANFTIIPSTGHEKYVQVNFLSTMLLGILFLPILKKKSPAGFPGRLTIVSSGTARGAKISAPLGTPVLFTLDDKPRPWDPVERYAVSKLLGHLFVLNLARYVEAADVIVNLVDPGLVKNTALQGFALPLVTAFFYCFKAVFGRSLPVGASTYVDAAVVKGKESHGCYVSNWNISSYAAFVYSSDGKSIRERLWEETMEEFDRFEVRDILGEVKSRMN